ncbi:MAG: molecular chaperone DnaJ [Chloroflexi bacterium]|jgi:DnaJ-class molecular chaperone|nr:MAG: molecular chaperone DnaJ [Chloroflexota bacterium]
MAKDFYSTLGINRSASDKEIRQAFRRLARKFHPDVNPGDNVAEAKFKEINEAYEVLLDSEKRRRYDQYGDNWKHPNQGGFNRQSRGARGVSVEFGDLRHFGNLGSVFEGLFDGGASRRNTPVEIATEISLEEAYVGARRTVQLPRPHTKRIEVRLPAGVESGSRIHVNAAAVDIYLVVKVTPHRRLTRKGDNLYTDLPISLVETILGSEQEVTTIKGKVMLTVPPESQNGQMFRLKGQGMPSLEKKGHVGDLFASLKVILPNNLTDEEIKLFEALKQARTGKTENL